MQWENPPEPERGPAVPWVAWVEEAEALRTRPGKWAALKTYPAESADAAHSMAHKITAGRLKAFSPRGTFEGTARTHDGESIVYARYLA